jgi:integrase
VGAKTVLNAMQLLGSIFRHARRFKWVTANPLEDVHRPSYQSKVAAFTPAQIAALLEAADAETGLFIRVAASTGLRVGEIAGLRWSDVDLGKGSLEVRQQFSHGQWSELKTSNARRSIPLPVVATTRSPSPWTSTRTPGPRRFRVRARRPPGWCYLQVVAKRSQTGAKCRGRASVATSWPFARHGTVLKSMGIP